MKLAIMQPYFFPYIGYFQLIYAVDKFIFYDDVNFIKQGWINRNRILIGERPTYFTVPLDKASPNRKICEIKISEKEYKKWHSKFIKTLYLNYKKAPYFESVYYLIDFVLKRAYEHFFIFKLSAESIIKICEYLNIEKDIEFSSITYANTAELVKEKRLIRICEMTGADTYYNSEGGITLYKKVDFNKYGIKLFFLKSKNITYNRLNYEFFPNLSIIDVMMFNSKEEIRKMLNEYELI